MKRHKRNRVKKEKPETSTLSKEALDHDLAYYIHDRVELMHQVFSVLRHKDIKAMAPDCVRRLSVENLQELCTEELLGISSKRLCAILDGAEPPSDTESSTGSEGPELMETISLDSISSDDEILSQTSNSKKKKKKHRRDKPKKKKKPDSTEAADQDKSRASRAGLTVLELLELQARARAIRAQLQQEQAKNKAPAEPEDSSSSSSSEVEIKEERPEVVEISSEDEKPDIGKLQTAVAPKETDKASPTKEKETNKKSKEKKKKKDKEKGKNKQKKKNETETTRKDSTASVDSEKNNKEKNVHDVVNKDITKDVEIINPGTTTKRVNDLIITVPHKPTRKIKLNRNKVTISLSNTDNKTAASAPQTPVTPVTPVQTINIDLDTNKEKQAEVINNAKKPGQDKQVDVKTKDKGKKKQKKKDKRKSLEKDGSDHDEITLQLSESEKMDLLEDLDRKNYDVVSSSSEDSESTDSSSDDDDDEDSSLEAGNDSKKTDDSNDSNEPEKPIESAKGDKIESEETLPQKVNVSEDKIVEETLPLEVNVSEEKIVEESTENVSSVSENVGEKNKIVEADKNKDSNVTNGVENNGDAIVIKSIEDIPLQDDSESLKEVGGENICVTEKDGSGENVTERIDVDNDKNSETQTSDVTTEVTDGVPGELNRGDSLNQDSKDTNAEDKSEGEISPAESSEVEAVDIQPEVVYISDEEGKKNKKKKKKKDKKSKHEKKAKKSKQDFREGGDQNFYKIDDNETEDIKIVEDNKTGDKMSVDDDDVDDDVYEILALSDDSSCYEVEGTVLSKEPTAEEIEALSAKIDEIDRSDVVTDEQIIEYEKKQAEINKNIEEHNEEDLENISWKDRYLVSTKVKKVLTTANILNALRKKNKELKKKMEDSKKIEDTKIEDVQVENEKIEEKDNIEEGSIEHYNTLEGSTKYVDPVPDPAEKSNTNTEQNNDNPENTQNTDVDTQTSADNAEKMDIKVTGEMKKDAKTLLKIYKKLLKYNEKSKAKDPNKKKKKTKKKKDVKKSVSE